jgi:hypothetical protein
MEAGPGLTFEDTVSRGGPGEGFQRKGRNGLEFLRGEFEGVDAQPGVRRGIVTGEEGVIFFPQEGFHAGKEFRGERRHRRSHNIGVWIFWHRIERETRKIVKEIVSHVVRYSLPGLSL